MSIDTPEAQAKPVNIPDARPGRGRAVVVEGVTESSEEAGSQEDDDDEQSAGDDAEHDTNGEEGGGGDTGSDDEGEESGEEGAEGAAPDDAAPELRDDSSKPAKEPWYTKRIGKLTKENSEREAKLRAAEEKIAAMEAAGGENAPKLYTEAEVEARIERRASEKSEAAQINTKLDDMFDKGVATHKDFEKRVQAYGQAFGPDLAKRVDFFTAVSDLDNGADVLHALGGDLDRMADILDMPPARMGIALAQMSAKMAAPKPKPLSKAPVPIKPLEANTKRAASIDDPNISQEEYTRLRREQRAARAEAQNR